MVQTILRVSNCYYWESSLGYGKNCRDSTKAMNEKVDIIAMNGGNDLTCIWFGLVNR